MLWAALHQVILPCSLKCLIYIRYPAPGRCIPGGAKGTVKRAIGDILGTSPRRAAAMASSLWQDG
jgi:hypothetical protein